MSLQLSLSALGRPSKKSQPNRPEGEGGCSDDRRFHRTRAAIVDETAGRQQPRHDGTLMDDDHIAETASGSVPRLLILRRMRPDNETGRGDRCCENRHGGAKVIEQRSLVGHQVDTELIDLQPWRPARNREPRTVRKKMVDHGEVRVEQHKLAETLAQFIRLGSVERLQVRPQQIRSDGLPETTTGASLYHCP